MERIRKKMSKMQKDELQVISLRKNQRGTATREARVAQELLWEKAEHIYTVDIYDSENYFPVNEWEKYCREYE